MCTFNKMVNSEQLTVQFHVDDLKVSHKEQSVLEDFLGNLRSEFGQEDKLTENTGLVHEYLGITIDYSIAGKVIFTMFDYLEDVIVEAANDLKNSCSYYPGNDQLMKVDYDSPSLSPKEQDNTSVVQLERKGTDGNQAVKEPNISLYNTFISLTDSSWGCQQSYLQGNWKCGK